MRKKMFNVLWLVGAAIIVFTSALMHAYKEAPVVAKEENKEGFTPSLNGLVRPQARNMRLMYENFTKKVGNTVTSGARKIGLTK